MNAPLLPLIAVALGGVAISLQAPINAALGSSLGHPVAAAAVSFGIGFVVLAALTLVLAGLGGVARLPLVPVWQLLGGFLGAYYVWSVLWGVPSLGVLALVATLTFGQMAAALIIDSSGWFGLPVQPLSPQRLAAAAMVAGALVLSRL